MTKRILSLLAAVAVASTAACGGDTETETAVQRDTFMQQDTEMVNVVAPVVTEDTGVVETRIETEVETDTIRNP